MSAASRESREPIVHRVPTDSTVKQLYATAFGCGEPSCREPLYRESERAGELVLNSRVAHICARSEGGPRWDGAMSEEENRHADNLLPLCLSHAAEIDEQHEHYPVDLLRDWKQTQLAEYRKALKGWYLSDAQVAEVAETSFPITQLTAAIAEIVPFSARSRSREEALERAARQSAARRRVQLQPVPAERLEAVTEWMHSLDDAIVDVPEGQVRVLVAPMGAGKSEQAARWWDQALREAQADPAVEIPVWLTARNALSGLEAAVIASIGGDPKRPCRIVLDDLDSVGPSDARRLLDEARELVLMWPKTRVLATARPDVPVNPAEHVDVEPWTTRRGLELVRLVAGEETAWRSWTAETLATLERPLTALALAARLAEGGDSQVSTTQLLADLAGTIARRKRPDGATADTWHRLARLAARILGSTGPVSTASFDSEPLVWQLTDTGLVSVDGTHVAFALPVFEQHFGAQAIRSGIVSLHEVAGPRSFARWRYALVLAISQPDDERRADADMAALARLNPAAASWILDQIAPEGSHRRAPEHSAESNEADPSVGATSTYSAFTADAVQTGTWLREAHDAFLEGTGPLGPLLARHHGGRHVQWGVWLNNGRMTVALARDAVEPHVVEMPEPMPKITGASGWAAWTQYDVPNTRWGRWHWARERLRRPLLDLINRRRLPVSRHSPLAGERLWFLAAHILHTGASLERQPIDVTHLRERVNDMMATVEASVQARWQWPGYTADSADIRWVAAQLEHLTTDALQHPRPRPDRPGIARRPAWHMYSPALTQSAVADILRDAVTGYRDLVEANFPAFGTALGLYSVLPIRVDALVELFDDEQHDWDSGLTYALQPDPAVRPVSAATVRLAVSTRHGQTSDAMYPQIAERQRLAAFFEPEVASGLLPTHWARPATNLAYQWLARDLHSIGWLSQTVEFHN